MQRTAVAVEANTDSIKSDLHTQEIKSWLNPPDPSTNANHARALRHKGTGMWLLENSVFRSWYLGSHRHTWLHGLAGCGKTVLSTTVLDHLENGTTVLSSTFSLTLVTPKSRPMKACCGRLRSSFTKSGLTLQFILMHHFKDTRMAKTNPRQRLSGLSFITCLGYRRESPSFLDESTSRDDIVKWIEDIASKPELAHSQVLYTSRPESEFLRRIPI